MKQLFILTIALFTSTYIFAQRTIELGSISQQYSAAEKYDSVYVNDAKERVFNAEVTIPIRTSDSNIWYTNIAYENFILESENAMPANVANPINIKGISLRSGIIRSFSNNRQLYLFLNPKLAGDLKNINWNTFQLGAIALIGKDYREDFSLRVGLGYFHDYAGPFIVPLVYIYRQYGRKLSMYGTLPQDFKILYKLTRRFACGAQEFATTRVYHLGDNNYRNDYIFRGTVNLSLFVRYKLLRRDLPLYLELSGGYAYDREYSQYGENEGFKVRFPAVEIAKGNQTSKTIGFNDGTFLNAKLVYDVKIPK
jgi:hypothetical protein